MICYKVGGILFEKSAYWPFFFIGICWLAMFMLTTILFSCGIYEKRVNKARRTEIVQRITEASNLRITEKRKT